MGLMNKFLLKEVAKIEEQASSYNYNILSIPTFNGDGIVFGNKDNGQAVLLIVKNTSNRYIVKAFSIDVKKWKWADLEGFDSNAIINKMGAEIFKSIPLDQIFNYL